MILGDNIYYGEDFECNFKYVVVCESGVIVFVYYVNDFECYGVVEFDV